MNLRCAQGCEAPLAPLTDAGVVVYFCGQCRGTFCPSESVSRWLSTTGSIASSVPPQGLLTLGMHDARSRTVCPSDGAMLRAIPLVPGERALRCERCSAVFVMAGALPELRATFMRPSRAPRSVPAGRSNAPPHSEAEGEARPEGVLAFDRVAFNAPWVDLLALPGALLLSMLVSLSELGRLCLYPVQLQFHELGHAIFAWLSSRAALPLPFGFTFWREDKSLFTGMCMLFLLGVLGYRGFHERRKFAVALALTLSLVFVLLSLVVKPETSLMLMLAGGIAGEFILSCLVMVAFFFPMPDRLRWDFFRFVVLLPATGTWVASAQLWVDVSRGARPLPMGSILGTTGDGSGDLDRLIAGHGFTPASLTHGYLSLAGLTATVLALTYGWFALRAMAALQKR